MVVFVSFFCWYISCVSIYTKEQFFIFHFFCWDPRYCAVFIVSCFSFFSIFSFYMIFLYFCMWKKKASILFSVLPYAVSWPSLMGVMLSRNIHFPDFHWFSFLITTTPNIFFAIMKMSFLIMYLQIYRCCFKWIRKEFFFFPFYLPYFLMLKTTYAKGMIIRRIDKSLIYNLIKFYMPRNTLECTKEYL